MRAIKLVAIVMAAAVSACTVNPYTGEQQASKAATYGGAAAAVCALVGAMDSREKARNAALGCGLVGAGVGAYMDVQEAKLRTQLEGTGVRVVREGDNIRLVMPGSITFETDSYNLRADFYSVLDSVGLVLSKYADTTLRVVGHTDSTGGKEHNQALSENRARSVATYLGIFLALNWVLGLALCATWLAIAFVTRYSSLAALFAAGSAPIWMFVVGGMQGLILAALMMAFLHWRHKPNLERLKNQTEPKIGQKA